MILVEEIEFWQVYTTVKVKEIELLQVEVAVIVPVILIVYVPT